ncbi:MAG: methionyl-tRNA formyltransferase [Herpetosiphonaceae bacterium]|nr:methionyl-tRNA formyltransferase [Herpetosiphonaceae bacterium]
MRILFLGTPTFAAIPLRALVAAGHDVVGVVTQPDRPAGRGGSMQAPPVKLAATELGLPVLQPPTLKEPVVVEQLAALRPDVGVVAAYGEILRKAVLALPSLGYLNIHPSLLPLYRGPSPVSAAVLAGDEVTGVSVMLLERAMDAGPILAQAVVPLAPTARSGPLTDELFQLGAELLVRVLPLYAKGELQAVPQEHSRATFSSMLRKADGELDWREPALVLERKLRAFDPWPGVWTMVEGVPLKILAATVEPTDVDAPPGMVLPGEQCRVMTGSGVLEVHTVQPSGKRPMAGADWLRGLRDRSAVRLGR